MNNNSRHGVKGFPRRQSGGDADTEAVAIGRGEIWLKLIEEQLKYQS